METSETASTSDEGTKSDLKVTGDSSSSAFSLELLSRDLIQCKRERDEYKAVADRLRCRCHALASKLHVQQHTQCIVVNHCLPFHLLPQDRLSEDRSSPLAPVLMELAQQNKYLLWQVEQLKGSLVQAEADLDLLRSYIPAGPRRLDQVESQLLYFRSQVRLMERELQVILLEKEHEQLVHERQISELKRHNEILEETLRRTEEPFIESSE